MNTTLIDWFISNIDALSALLSVLVSLALLGVVYQQYQLLRLEKLPDIDIHSRNMKGDELTVIVSNHGSGIGKNARFETALQVADVQDQAEEDLTPDCFEQDIAVTRARKITEHSEKSLERTIGPNQREIVFQGEPSLNYQINGELRSAADFHTGFRQLYRDGVKTVWFQIYFVVDDRLGGCQAKRLFWPNRESGDIAKQIDEIEEKIDLEEAYNSGGLRDEEYEFSPDINKPNCRD